MTNNGTRAWFQWVLGGTLSIILLLFTILAGQHVKANEVVAERLERNVERVAAMERSNAEINLKLDLLLSAHGIVMKDKR